MALALIVEDGSGVTGANSYADLTGLRAYADRRGIAVPVDDDDLVRLTAGAMDYLEAFGSKFIGNQKSFTQALQWPRVNARTPAGYCIPVNIVPGAIIAAQCYLTCVATTVELNFVQDTRTITKEVIGPIETDYSATGGATVGPVMPQLSALLSDYLRQGVGTLRSLRV